MTARTHRRGRATLATLLPLAGLVGLWALVTHLEVFSPLVLPPPARVYTAGRAMWASGELSTHVVASLRRVAGGTALGATLGIGLGLAMAHWRPVRLLLQPTIEMFRPVASLVWIPLVLVWLGIGELGKVLLISYGVFYPTWTNTYDGARQVDPRLLQAARSLGCRPHRLVLRVRLPAALPRILTGLSLGIGTGFSVMIAAELMGASSGLGWMIANARRFFRTDVVLLGMFVVGMLGFLTVVALGVVRSLVPWLRRSEA